MFFLRANCRGLPFRYRYLCRTRQTSALALSDQVELAAPRVRRTAARTSAGRSPFRGLEENRPRGMRGSSPGSGRSIRYDPRQPCGEFRTLLRPRRLHATSPSWARMERLIGSRVRLSGLAGRGPGLRLTRPLDRGDQPPTASVPSSLGRWQRPNSKWRRLCASHGLTAQLKSKITLIIAHTWRIVRCKRN